MMKWVGGSARRRRRNFLDKGFTPFFGSHRSVSYRMRQRSCLRSWLRSATFTADQRDLLHSQRAPSLQFLDHLGTIHPASNSQQHTYKSQGLQTFRCPIAMQHVSGQSTPTHHPHRHNNRASGAAYCSQVAHTEMGVGLQTQWARRCNHKRYPRSDRTRYVCRPKRRGRVRAGIRFRLLRKSRALAARESTRTLDEAILQIERIEHHKLDVQFSSFSRSFKGSVVPFMHRHRCRWHHFAALAHSLCIRKSSLGNWMA